jgi:hypothetical protein
MQIGDRVGAIRNADDSAVYLYGYGVYNGMKRPPYGLFGVPIEKMPENYTNPCILLDNGETVWGLECWWGSEEKIKKAIGNKKIITVSKETTND